MKIPTLEDAKKCKELWLAGKPCGEISGAGDVVAALTSSLGIKPCGGCKERQEKLNKWFPFTNPDTQDDDKSE
jgi:hypothetical protein